MIYYSRQGPARLAHLCPIAMDFQTKIRAGLAQRMK
jgi:hypothetical protein